MVTLRTIHGRKRNNKILHVGTSAYACILFVCLQSSCMPFFLGYIDLCCSAFCFRFQRSRCHCRTLRQPPYRMWLSLPGLHFAPWESWERKTLHGKGDYTKGDQVALQCLITVIVRIVSLIFSPFFSWYKKSQEDNTVDERERERAV